MVTFKGLFCIGECGFIRRKNKVFTRFSFSIKDNITRVRQLTFALLYLVLESLSGGNKGLNSRREKRNITIFVAL